MKSTAFLPRPDEDLVALMTGLFGTLPDSIWAADGLEQRIWDTALLDPALDMLSRSGKGVRAMLLSRAWELSGGSADGPPELLLVMIELLHVGSLIIDDIEDDSRLRRGRPALHRLHGLPLALNTGNWLYFLAMAVLARSQQAPDVRLALYEDVSLALMRCHQGQALDLSVRVTSLQRADVPELVATSTRLKTGSLMQLAATLGARSANAPQARLAAVSAFGAELGVALQMLDDWSGINSEARREKGREDVRHARLTWPWAWLAAIDDDLSYRQTVRQVREISLDWEADLVLERLRALLAPVAPGEIRAQLAKALEGLASGLGEGTDLSGIRSDLAELEQAYG